MENALMQDETFPVFAEVAMRKKRLVHDLWRWDIFAKDPNTVFNVLCAFHQES